MLTIAGGVVLGVLILVVGRAVLSWFWAWYQDWWPEIPEKRRK